MKRTLGRSIKGNLIYATDAEILENAQQQERDGVKPHYCLYNHRTGKKETPAGWLVWSLTDRCGVVYRREDGKLIICTGVQGDFCYC